MTSQPWLSSWIGLVADLPCTVPEAERYRRLLGVVRATFPCDAVSLLRLQGRTLVPLAIEGLAPDTMGRRFRLDAHPRLLAMMQSDGPLRLPSDSRLPDPFDGLVEGAHVRPEDGRQVDLEVHDCMGCRLTVDGEPWGLLTLDSLTTGSFTQAHEERLSAFANLASATVNTAAHLRRLQELAETEQQQVERYRRAAGAPPREMIGHSTAFRQMLREIDLVGPSDLTVLVTGETGVGKEMVAEALHAKSSRSGRPLVSLNCAALPDTLVESELFGHVRGAFTGAVADRQGKFELAHGGTLFLDEVGELPLAVQAKLLRVLQSGQIQRLGSDREHRVDVRLVVATNRDLSEEVREGRMRADIYHRLSAFPLRVPPLRERESDVLLLAGRFLEENRARLGLGTLHLDASAQQALMAYAWPGNVRELEHLIGRSVLRAMGRMGRHARVLPLSAADLGLQDEASPKNAGNDAAPVPTAGSTCTAPGPGWPGDDAPPEGLRRAVDAYERRLLETSLARHRGSWAGAARELQMDRANLTRLAKRLGLHNAPAAEQPRALSPAQIGGAVPLRVR